MIHITITGPRNSGKTVTAARIYNALVDHDLAVTYVGPNRMQEKQFKGLCKSICGLPKFGPITITDEF